MPERREGIENGHGRVASEFVDFFLFADTSEYALAHSTNDACTVASGFVDTELDVFAAKKEGASTQENRGCFGRETSARAALREEQCDRLAEQRLRGHAKAG